MTFTVLNLPVHDHGSSPFLAVLPFPSAVFYSFIFCQYANPTSYFVYACLCSVSPRNFTSCGAQFLWLFCKMPWELKTTSEDSSESDRCCVAVTNVPWKRPMLSLIALDIGEQTNEEDGPQGQCRERRAWPWAGEGSGRRWRRRRRWRGAAHQAPGAREVRVSVRCPPPSALCHWPPSCLLTTWSHLLSWSHLSNRFFYFLNINIEQTPHVHGRQLILVSAVWQAHVWVPHMLVRGNKPVQLVVVFYNVRTGAPRGSVFFPAQCSMFQVRHFNPGPPFSS